MTSHSELVQAHYQRSALTAKVDAALAELGVDGGSALVKTLVALDSFHLRGRVATQELASLAGVQGGERVLDVGCGPGGTARYLAGSTGGEVTGLDLTPELVALATHLSALTGQQELTRFVQGSALALPFDAGSFDVVWLEHVQMNIADKGALFAELARVLAPGGRLALHEVCQGPGGAAHLPVPWSGDPQTSFLVPPEVLRAALESAGFTPDPWRDVTDDTRDWVLKRRRHFARLHEQPLGIHLLLGPDAATKMENVASNLAEDRIGLVMAVAGLRA